MTKDCAAIFDLGSVFYADTVGTKRILDRVVAFHKGHGARWKPAGLLVRLAETGKTFSDHDAERVT